jgi:hypothetical protein
MMESARFPLAGFVSLVNEIAKMPSLLGQMTCLVLPNGVSLPFLGTPAGNVFCVRSCTPRHTSAHFILGQQEDGCASKTGPDLTLELQPEQVYEAPASTMAYAATAGQKEEVAGADTNKRSDRQGSVGDHQRTPSTDVPHERTHISDLAVLVSPSHRDDIAGG